MSSTNSNFAVSSNSTRPDLMNSPITTDRNTFTKTTGRGLWIKKPYYLVNHNVVFGFCERKTLYTNFDTDMWKLNTFISYFGNWMVFIIRSLSAFSSVPVYCNLTLWTKKITFVTRTVSFSHSIKFIWKTCLRYHEETKYRTKKYFFQ